LRIPHSTFCWSLSVHGSGSVRDNRGRASKFGDRTVGDVDVYQPSCSLDKLGTTNPPTKDLQARLTAHGRPAKRPMLFDVARSLSIMSEITVPGGRSALVTAISSNTIEQPLADVGPFDVDYELGRRAHFQPVPCVFSRCNERTRPHGNHDSRTFPTRRRRSRLLQLSHPRFVFDLSHGESDHIVSLI